jgi:uncharacterized protein YfaS (alpha-2-macroglobulin family)
MSSPRILARAALAALVLFTWTTAMSHARPPRGPRAQVAKSYDEGNFKQAFEAFRTKALDPQADPRAIGEEFPRAIDALNRLGSIDQVDKLLDDLVAVHPANWRMLWVAARAYIQLPHFGYVIAGRFERGHHRGDGQSVQCTERDRARALQLVQRAMAGARADEHHAEVAKFYLDVAKMLLLARTGHQAWRLQALTDLNALPDYEPGWSGAPRTAGAPVDAQGNPVFYHVPKSFEAARSDGERWRWCLTQVVEFDAALVAKVHLQLADFLHGQFGVQTLGGDFRPRSDDRQPEEEAGIYALHTLGEDETIARLATGVKRFKLPDEFNYIRLYRQVAAEGNGELPLDAWSRLAQVFENRRQYPKAADCWRECTKRSSEERYRRRLEQIEGNWGRFERTVDQAAGRGAEVEYRFRNGRRVELVAHEIHVQKLLDDVKAYLKSRPGQLDWRKLQISELGYQLIEGDQTAYVGRQVAAWTLDLQPRENHFDRRITITTPLQKAGAYLLTAKMADGNTSYAVVWLDDTAIVRKQLDGKLYYFIADAETGRPVGHADVEFFGWRQERRDNRFELSLRQFAERADAQGQVTVVPETKDDENQWLIIARAAGGRFAYLGFDRVWTGRRSDIEYRETKVFTITDRPVYRPGQPVHFKFWVQQARYDQPDVSLFAGQSFAVEILNPKGDKVLTRTFRADAYGGFEGQWDLPADAPLGEYQLMVVDRGGGSFRVEEYKKPEFEVDVKAPEKPVMLGEKIQATIQAKYYFGSPVTKAKVKYKVQRSTHEERWFPVAPWDWLYGPGYWWFAYDYDWLPGWSHWGWRRPVGFWWPGFGHVPPEIVAEREVEIGPDGTLKVEIDTALAKAQHPDQDHEYTITAEVTDQSRRTIVGTGKVLAARKAFAVTVWPDRGYFRVGDPVVVSMAARTPDGKPVAASGTLQLLQIRYENGRPVETPVQSWNVATGEEGHARQQLTASQAGQYRLSAKLTDAGGHTIEGGYVLNVMGQGFEASQFRFQHLELIPETREYRPGDKVRLLINTDRPGSTVLLFVRPCDGVYPAPEILHLEGKSTVREIEVVQRDMPNFFVEAVTVADGRVYSELKEIVVPPEKRVLNVVVEPSAADYRPGQKAEVKLRVTDFHGQPFVGSLVVAMYDKSVEYISGGSNVPEIKDFFWRWRRDHQPLSETNLGRTFYPFQPPRTVGMGDLGAFGETVIVRESARAGGVKLKSASRLGGAMDEAMPAAAPMAAMAAPAREADGMAGMGGSQSQSLAQPLVQPTVRTKFADTALWVGALTTDQQGRASVPLVMPENLTTWRIKTWAMGHGTKVGGGSADVVTRKNLIVRLQAPRFFVERDEVVLSANVHNYLKGEKLVRVGLELAGGTLAAPAEAQREVRVAAGGEARVDWRVRVVGEGQAVVRMKALTDEESDATEQSFPCYVHGMLKTESWSGVIRPDGQAGRFTVNVPAQRRVEQTRLEVRWSPTLAGALVDALPYLADYPYGCTEQTLNRFLPSVVTQKILIGMGLDLAEIGKHQTNLNAQELGDDRQRAEGWKRPGRNPVFDSAELARMVKQGLERLTEMQLSDGGWGWFSGWGETSSPHLTATVVHGLQIAKQNDLALVPEVLERGVAWLKRYQQEQLVLLRRSETKPKDQPWKAHADDLDALVYMVLVDAGADNAEMRDRLHRDRNDLAVYSLAMLGLAVEKVGDREKLDMLLRNLSQYVAQDEENQTAWLRLPENNWWWCWYGSDIEAQSYYLKLLARTDPKGQLASRLVKYLLNNRKHATYWNSTRDTAVAIEALADYLRTSGEQRPEMNVEIRIDGKHVKTVEITPANLFRFDNKLVLEGAALSAGKHEVELRRTGQGPLYYNGYLTNFTLEDHIAAAGLEVKVQRKYYRLVRQAATVQAAGGSGQVLDQQVEKYRREELKDLDRVVSGQLVEIELEIQSKNDYEYLMFEDMKPAGFEPVDLRSGYTGNALGAYMEFRDNRVVFFVRQLARGDHSVSYRMRAEIPGRFSALPTRAAAMYAPELKGNSDEIKLQVEDESK